MKPRLAQLHQSGATDGQVPGWSAALGYWQPVSALTTVCRTTWTAAGGENVIYLGSAPVGNSEQVFVSGVYLHPGIDYSLSGTTLVLTSAVSTGAHVTVAYIAASSSCGVSSLIAEQHHGFKRPTPLTRPVRRFHRIR